MALHLLMESRCQLTADLRLSREPHLRPVARHPLVYSLTPLRIRSMYAVTRNDPQLLDMQPQNDAGSLPGVGVAVGAACSRGSRHTDGSVGADVPRGIAIGYEDLEAAASVVVVRRVGEV